MIYNKLVKHVLLPLYYYRNDNRLLKRLAALEESQYLAPGLIAQQQAQKLTRLLQHCHQNVPYYRSVFDAAGFTPGRCQESPDLSGVPFLTKGDLQHQLQRLTAENYPPQALHLDSSGGSTGKPTNFYKDSRRYYESLADMFRHDRWSGWELGEKMATLWGAQREFEKQPSLRSRLLARYLFRTYGFNAFDISEEKVLRCLEQLKRIRPTMVLAYANVARLFATVIAKHQVDLSGLRLKAVICSAETLTDPMREAIGQAFHCPVLNRYGSREVGVIASECLHREGLHINCDALFVEVIRDGKAAEPGQPGEIVVTDLWNYGMPLVRYRTGDVGVACDRPCSCGRTLPMLKEVQGRVSDFLMDATGGLVHGEYFTHLFYGLKGIEQFQLIQEDRNTVYLKIVPGPGFQSRSLDPVLQKIRLCLGAGVAVHVTTCDRSLTEQSGKFRFTVSKISGNAFGKAMSGVGVA